MPASEPAGPAVAIGIATYRRPALLRQLLESLRDLERPVPVSVYVVDNDADGSAREVAAEFADLDVRYSVEPAPGIAEARNAFLRAVADETHVAFVDDDERVAPDWLVRLWDAAHAYDAEVVAGPVVPVFPPNAPTWAIAGGFFERPRVATGQRMPLAATNNSLVRRTALQRLDSPWFDPAFSRTGGSDSDLFHRMVAAGATIVWCDEAVVEEDVPLERMTWEWVKRRAERTGNVRARLLLNDGKRLRVGVEGVARLAVGGLRITTRTLRRRPVDAHALNTWMRGLGLLRAMRGDLIQEYQRS
ncbi:glycosyltransferase family 2 protein [Microbacterium sp. No. 7]|uniref:glycosyltransferase family 2 protein n=1 Tax=Microbacterium sp. No. 7 TaxID=1714373 RepID=UPI0006D23F14|nr:glycosyltransferase family 2 protein [Microbacterium sp. No. 7]ALJ19074.1 hypothetical protein AOA12_03805 [Microbacterium sp. No. 7]